MDLPGPLALLLVPMIFAIELLGLFIKHFVLAVRLLANMMAGHLVLAVIVAFIAASGRLGSVLGGHAGQRAGGHRVESAGVVCRLLAGVHFYVLVGPVYRHAVHPH